MLIQPTLDQLYKMRLNGMAEAFLRQLGDPNAAELSFEERSGLLVDSHYVWKENRALARRLSLAKLKVKGVLEDIDFRHPRGLDRARLLSLANESRWVRLKQNIVLVGPTGIGKSFLACALAHKACRDRYRALYTRAPQLFRDLRTAHAEGTFVKLLNKLARIDCLIVDDFAMDPMRESGATFWRSATTASTCAPRCGPASCRRGAGTTRWATRPRPTASSTACCTSRTASTWTASRCARCRGGRGMKAACHLKQPRGWFAAGEGFRRALGLLSDGAFKLFAFICLHAERPGGELSFERAELGRHLAELAGKGVCEIEPAANQHRASRLRVLPAFWPYRETPSPAAEAAPAARGPGSAAYVAGVRQMLARPSCVQARFTAAEERLAEAWHRAGIPLETVRRALLLGCLRKSFALIDRPGGQPIGSLRYFEGPRCAPAPSPQTTGSTSSPISSAANSTGAASRPPRRPGRGSGHDPAPASGRAAGCLPPRRHRRRDEMMILIHPHHKGSPLDGGPPKLAP